MIVNVTAAQIRSWPVNAHGWHVSPDTQDWIQIGSGAEIGSYAEIGSGAEIGSYAKIGSGAESVFGKE